MRNRPREWGDFDRYDGWERIHDDNKAEGRPTGGQWSKEGVRYVNGRKVYERRTK